jgi:antitoxin MazE
MKSIVSKWGNSLAIRIPKAYAEQLHLTEGASVDINVNDDSLVVSRPSYTLEGLLAGITADNLHAEVDSTGPVGKEAW